MSMKNADAVRVGSTVVEGTIVLALFYIRHLSLYVFATCGLYCLALCVQITTADFVIADVTDSMLDGVIAG